MLELVNRLWIVMPLSYAITVGGLVSGYRRGGVPSEARVPRALVAGFPVLVACCSPGAASSGSSRPSIHAPPLLGLRAGVVLHFRAQLQRLDRRCPGPPQAAGAVERGTVVLDETPPETSAEPADHSLWPADPFRPWTKPNISRSSARPAPAKAPLSGADDGRPRPRGPSGIRRPGRRLPAALL